MRKRGKITITALVSVAVICSAVLYYKHYTTPVIELVGGDTTIQYGASYKEKGCHASYKGKDVTSLVQVSSVDVSLPGNKKEIYSLSVDGKKTEKVRMIHVVNHQKPRIILGGDEIDWVKGVSFNDLECRVKDIDPNVKVSVTNNVNVNKLGDYKEVYKAVDSSGNTSTKTRIIHVVEGKKRTTIPVCMYHYLYKKNHVPSNVGTNHISVETFSKEVDYLKKAHYYFPTYKEVRSFIDGKINLPAKAIVLSFDDGAKDTLPLLSKIANDKKVPITSFLITSKNGEEKRKKYENDYLSFESHTHNMHRPGGHIGHGGIFTALSVQDAVKDLHKSTKICGNHDALAYPFGDTNSNTREATKEAGFLVGFTTVNGVDHVGDDVYLLPRVRMFNNQSLSSFIDKVK